MIMDNKKIMTAIDTSVGADAKQSSHNYDTNIITNNDEKSNTANKKLETISMTELFDTEFLQKRPIIEGLLYEGLYMFVGAPKTGKSFAMEQIAYFVSSGIDIWERKVTQGTVLYLALEDDYARLQGRFYRMFDVETTPNLHLAVDSEMISKGLETQLKEFISEHTDTVLIIIDTFQKAREISGESFSYAKDYEVVSSLKKFADDNHTCIVLVHHTRKQEGTDAFDSISGTNGLFGAADGAFVLHKDKRTNADAILEVSGRDIQDQRLHLHRNEKCVWDLTKAEVDEFEEPRDEIIEELSSFINKDNPKWEGTAQQLCEHLSIEIMANQLTRKLNCNVSVLRNNCNISYKKNRQKDGVHITLQLID